MKIPSRIACDAAGDYQDAMTLIDLANPTKFLSLTARVLPWLAGATAILLLIGLYQSAMAPDDYQQGATVKIMFIHVPNAWLSMFVWGVMSLAALGTLVWRHPLADVAAKAAAPIGAAFTFLALVDGIAVGPADVGHLLGMGCAAHFGADFVSDVSRPDRAVARGGRSVARARAAAILTLVGAINMPIIKFSVDWWNTLHQPASVMRMGGPSLDRAFLIPLLVMAIGIFAAVRHAASGGDAQRDPAPPRARVADDASQPAGGMTRCRSVPTPPSS